MFMDAQTKSPLSAYEVWKLGVENVSVESIAGSYFDLWGGWFWVGAFGQLAFGKFRRKHRMLVQGDSQSSWPKREAGSRLLCIASGAIDLPRLEYIEEAEWVTCFYRDEVAAKAFKSFK